MSKEVEEYLTYLKIQKKYSEHTIKKYAMIYQEYEAYLQVINKTILNIETVELKNFTYQLYDRSYKSATIANYISSLKSLYKYFIQIGYLENNITKNLKYPKKENKLYEIIYQEELQQFFTAIEQEKKYQKRNKALFLLLYTSGIRVSECANLQLKDINYEENLVKVYGKRKKERIVPITQETIQAIQVYIATQRQTLDSTNKNKYMFLNNQGQQLTDRGIRYLTTKFCKKAALYTNISPHKFRHTLATNLLNNGMDLRLIQEILGHETLTTTQKYTHITNNQLQNIYNGAIKRS